MSASIRAPRPPRATSGSNGAPPPPSYTLELIAARLPTLAASEQRVARAVLDHPYEFLDWSAAELGRASSTSGATAVRACRRLGFSGLADLRLTLARDLGWPSAESRQGPAAGPGAAGTAGVVQDVFDEASRLLPAMVLPETAAAFAKAVATLAGAQRILAVAVGPSGVFALDFAYTARVAGIAADFWHDSIAQHLAAASLTAGDACLAISASGINALTLEAAETAKRRRAKVVAVTGFGQSPLAEVAHTVVRVETLDYSTRRRTAVNAAGLLLMLRSLVIAVQARLDGGLKGARDSAERSAEVFARFTTTTTTAAPSNTRRSPRGAPARR